MTNAEIIAELKYIRRYNYTLAPEEVFYRAIEALSEQRTGHWIAYQNKQVCSECGNAKPLGVATYCRGCGAKME